MMVGGNRYTSMVLVQISPSSIDVLSRPVQDKLITSIYLYITLLIAISASLRVQNISTSLLKGKWNSFSAPDYSDSPKPPTTCPFIVLQGPSECPVLGQSLALCSAHFAQAFPPCLAARPFPFHTHSDPKAFLFF